MKALILGGYSARMQPSLTFTIPKPLIEFASKPIILYQIEALEAVGVTEVIVAVNYQAQVMQNFLKEHETRLRIKISLSIETEPLGTAGPLALARDKLIDGSGEPFFVLNGDVFCEYPFKEMITFHKSHAGEASILITKNNFEPDDELLPYAAIGLEKSSGKVTSFVEKPESGNEMFKRISTGIYLLNPSILDGIIEVKRTWLEKQVFPRLVADGKVFGVWLKGLFWLDAWLMIDQQKYYMNGLVNHLHDLRKRCPQKLASGAHIVGDVVVDETAEIGEGCVIGPNVAIGPGCVIEAGVKISSSAIMHGTRIKKGASVTYSIIGWRSSVGQLAKVEKTTMFATNFTAGGLVIS
ncbi:PREDICTED: mannose-1-phosphate guanylyltransferase 1-like isoform X2 [Ipomoea nil]|nr:PREDICTED: mannose-1-phosphate guanylyltransferase 1-like isoform X2 [Ipomoea nil]